MARKRGLFKFKKLKINGKTIFNIIGFGFVATAIISALSFFKFLYIDGTGVMLEKIHSEIASRFGNILSIWVPVILLLFGLLFFNSKKLKFIKINIALGSLLTFIALIGVFRSGIWGALIYQNLSLDFTTFGALTILFFTLIIGIILFLNTSIDVFALFILNLFKPIFSAFTKKGSKKDEKEDKHGDFIQDRTIFDKPLGRVPEKPKPMSPAVLNAAQKDFTIKPISPNTSTTWIYPPINLLQEVAQKEADRGDVSGNADTIEKTLDSFGIRARVSEVNKGPTVTQYALAITMGTKLSKITALANDLALALAAPTGQVRIEAPIPGRSLVGIEIPNIRSQIVTLRQMLSSPVFTESSDPLLVPLGLDVSGNPLPGSIMKMPHVLIAGTTGSGKSVMLNAWISTILFRTKPDEVRLILVDPKRVELTSYNGIPHLLTEVIVEPDKIISALRWTVSEMENRYKIFAQEGARNIESYNSKPGVEKKPYIVFVIDELADLMMFAPGDAEDLITRIAQMARATGIHLVLATQRPSVDVITGLMKANIPTRIAFNVSSLIDSRVIIDTPGAEKLLGKGDMLFLPPDQAKPRRIQGPYLTEKEVTEVVKFLRAQVPEVHYTEEITEATALSATGAGMGGSGGDGSQDPLFKQSLDIIAQFDKASASLLQRRLKIGYNRAARILDELHEAGYIGPSEGSKPREVLKRQAE